MKENQLDRLKSKLKFHEEKAEKLRKRIANKEGRKPMDDDWVDDEIDIMPSMEEPRDLDDK